MLGIQAKTAVTTDINTLITDTATVQHSAEVDFPHRQNNLDSGVLDNSVQTNLNLYHT